MKKVLIAVALLFNSCAPALYVNRLDNYQKLYPISPRDVKIFLNEKELPAEHERIAIIEIKDADADADLYGDMRKEASKIGANGVIQVEEKENGNINIGGSLLQGISIREKRNVKFLALRFKVNGEYPKKGRIEQDDMY
ncbi:hypothetical protein [Emticicia fontis]